MPEEEEMIGYCFKCKQNQKMEEVRESTTKNRRRILKGRCSVCGSKMTKFL